jgi:glycosyltransferase involved in cell wall biosynthesis
MLNGKTVGVVVAAYNEEKQINRVLDTMPDFVDKIVVINDGSKDKTGEIVKKYIEKTKSSTLKYKDARLREKLTPTWVENSNPEKDKVILLTHKRNAGKGAAVATGYAWCMENEIYCTATMDGDGQMDPKELESICLPIVNEEVEYVKGNRLSHSNAYSIIPKVRFIGNSILSLLTKIASGYWGVSDTQTGYTAIKLKTLEKIRIDKLYTDYGYPNDMLVKLNMNFCTLKEVPIEPIYGIGEQSKMKIFKVMPKISFLLIKSFFRRLIVKYLYKNFHPLFILYTFGFFSIALSLPFLIEVLNAIPRGPTLEWQFFAIFAFLSIFGVQSITFAMWMDMMDNERLYK